MGVIRLLLALTVVSAHCNSPQLFKLVGGEVAVQAFFMISGFYIAMIVDSYKDIKSFWISRFLRLYPVYIFCALITLIFLHGTKEYYQDLNKLPTSAFLFLIFTNITIFFQDLTMFIGVNNDAISFVKQFNESSPPLHQFLLIRQGWSLGLEISFYILAPFILTKGTRTIVVYLFISELVRILLIGFGYSFDPWSYRFFPSELSIFLLGSLAFKFYESRINSKNNSILADIGYVFIVLFIIAFTYLPFEYQAKKILFILSLSIFIGNIFSITKNSKIDNFIGSLSYPIYICHLFVFEYLLPTFNLPIPDGRYYTTIIGYTAVILFSASLFFIIEKPIDTYRHKFRKPQ
jgi:peptidoglycan/LPS O-acetylase OafA/YrhL